MRPASKQRRWLASPPRQLRQPLLLLQLVVMVMLV
jgi:hypothetical protein